MTIANYLTLVRLVLSPLFLLIYIYHQDLGISLVVLPYVLLFILTLSELSDACDGYFARKYNQVTDLGKILDPMADSIARISAFLAFIQPPVNLPIVLIFVLLYRDSVVSTLRTICALKGFALAARTSGKIKAVIQGGCAFIIVFLLIPYSRGELSALLLYQISTALVTIAAIYTAFSGLDYIYANRRYIAKLLTLRPVKNKSTKQGYVE